MDEGRRRLEVRGTPGQRSLSIGRARGPARWRPGGRAREGEVVGSTGLRSSGEEEAGRTEAGRRLQALWLVDRQEWLVGSVAKSRRGRWCC